MTVAAQHVKVQLFCTSLLNSTKENLRVRVTFLAYVYYDLAACFAGTWWKKPHCCV